MSKDYWVTVCSVCRRACCWHGMFMCDEAVGAGTVDVRASQLRKENNGEHPSYYSRESLIKHCGNVRDFEEGPEGAAR